MELTPLKLSGTYLVSGSPKCDERGYFARVWDEDIFRRHGLQSGWVQENQAFSKKKGVVRGLHFQRPPHSESKLVRVVAGAIWDVFVDVRKWSQTYGQWDAVELTAENHRAVYIPKGFAHGYCTLTDDTLVLYKVDAYYAPAAEGGLIWNDKTLNLPWPVQQPQLSAKDRLLLEFRDFETPFHAAHDFDLSSESPANCGPIYTP